MGIYLNPNNDLFQMSLNSKIYVDKTRLIHFTNDLIDSKDNFVCVSRPRRFGKSMALEMLNAYYSKGCDSRELFKGLSAGIKDTEDPDADIHSANYEKNMNAFDVIYIDMQGIIDKVLNNEDINKDVTSYYEKLKGADEITYRYTRHPLITAVQREVIKDIRKIDEYCKIIDEDEVFLGNALRSIYDSTGGKFVLLIDEWDCVFRNYEKDKTLQDTYIEWLRAMFKSSEMRSVYLMVYMTGILPIKRYGTESALNNFKEYTFLNPKNLIKFTGFTEGEVKDLCDKYNGDFDEMSRWYNGYVFETDKRMNKENKVYRIYNPRSVVAALEDGEFDNYWTTTGTYETIKKQIEMNFDGLKEKVVTMLGGGRCKVDAAKFQNDMVTFSSSDDVLTFLIHLGYLGYDAKRREAYIPNMEIRDEFVLSIDSSKYEKTYRAIEQSEILLEATINGDADTVATMIEEAHENHTSILRANDENSLSCLISLAYYKAQDDYEIIRELPTGKGFADIVFLPRRFSDKPAIVVELKWNKSAESAIKQIKEKNYAGRLLEYAGDVLLVGISYDRNANNRKHSCVIERVKL